MIASLRFNPIDRSLLPNNSIRSQLTSILIQVQQTDSPKTVNGFISTIKDMLNRLQAEQEEHRQVSEKMMDQCAKENEFRNQEVKAANDALAASNASRAKCDASLKASQKDLPELESSKKAYESELEKATQQRNDENASYQQRKKEYEEAIAFLNDFITYIGDKFAGNFGAFSFVEKSETLLKHASKLGLLAEAVPVLVVMAQAPVDNNTAADTFAVPQAQNQYVYTKNEDVAGKLKSTLNDLLARLKADWQTNEDTEAAAAKVFADYSAKLNGLIDVLAKNIQKTNEQIAAMTSCVTEEDAIIAKAGAKSSRNSGLLNSATEMCGSFAKEFTEATVNRLAEIKTIEEILSIIKARFGKLADDLVGYLQSVEAGWNTYINSTAFAKFSEYQQASLKVNAQGAALAVADADAVAASF